MSDVSSTPTSMPVYTIALNEATTHRRRAVDTGSTAQSFKSERACDFCRRRKTKCDGGRTQGDKCSNCIRNKVTCTYLEPSKPRGPPKSYVNALEDRIERFELLLKRLRPDTDFTVEIGASIPRDSWRKDSSKAQNDKNSNQAGPSARLSSSPKLINNPFSPPFFNSRSQHSIQSDNESVFSSDEEEEIPSGVLKRLTEYPTFPGASGTSSLAYESDLSMRFHGKSSFFPLLRVTRDFKKKFSLYDDDSPSPQNSDRSSDSVRSDLAPSTRRDCYWKVPPWERAWEQSRSMQPFCNILCPSGPLSQSESTRRHRCHAFPPQDLTLSLIALYFTHLNSQFPLLHKPLFYDQFNSNLHLQDTRFAATVWCIIANASRWSDDPRVLWTGWGFDENTTKDEKVDGRNLWLSAGWRFFTRGMDAFHHTQSIINPPHLFDVQTCSLAAMFLRCSTYPSNSWVVNGIGIRKAQDIGVHRKKVYNTKPNIDDELWKRAFWMLVSFDRIDSVLNGRPCCIPEEDFDLDLPLDVDDEYWIPVDPDRPPFVQPEGKPSSMSFFVHFCKLTQIYAYAMRTIYCIEKSTVVLNLVGSRWKEKVVTQLNTALNEWVDAIPKHLRWASKMDNEVFSNQSAVLYTCYYLCVILIYCPFISSPASSSEQPTMSEKRSPPSNSPYPALAICVNAAQSAVRTFEAQLRRGLSNIPNMLHAAQICTPILLLGVWDAKAKIADEDPNDPEYSSSRRRAYERILSDIRKCINALEISEARWGMARTVLEMLKESLPETGTQSESKPIDATGNAWDEQRHPTSFDRSSAQRTYQSADILSPTQFDRDAYVLHDSLPIRGATGHYMGDSPYAQMSSYAQMSPNKFQQYPLHVSAGRSSWNDHDCPKSHSSGSVRSITPELSTNQLQTVNLLPYAGATHNNHEQLSRHFLPISHTRRNPTLNETLPPPSQILSDVNLWRRTDGSAFSDLGQQSTSFTSYVRSTEDTSFSRMDDKRVYPPPRCYDTDPPLGR